MKIGLILAAAGLMLSGCGMAGCSGAATGGYAAGSCGVHATFFAARAANPRVSALRKS